MPITTLLHSFKIWRFRRAWRVPVWCDQGWRNTSVDVENLLLLLQELGHRVWIRPAKCRFKLTAQTVKIASAYFFLFFFNCFNAFFSVKCTAHVEIDFRSACIFLTATIPLPHESNRGSPAWSSYSSSMRALVGRLNPQCCTWAVLKVYLRQIKKTPTICNLSQLKAYFVRFRFKNVTPDHLNDI